MSESDDTEARSSKRLDMSRRSFLDVTATALAGSVVGIPTSGFAQQRHLGPPGMVPVSSDAQLAFLTKDEHAFIEAAVSRLIPSEGTGPGASEAAVPNFIDKQLAGPWGKGERLYTGAPFKPEAGPQFGYQLPFTPADLFRRAIAAIARKRKGEKAFQDLSPEEQDDFLRTELEGGGIGDLDGVPAQAFFAQLREMTVQGYFSDPSYGGNKNMVAWRAIGFPGAYASYAELIPSTESASTSGRSASLTTIRSPSTTCLRWSNSNDAARCRRTACAR